MNRLPLSTRYLAALVLGAVVWGQSAAFGATGDDGDALGLTALDRYVRAPDPAWRYEVLDTVAGEGYRTFVLEMVSQQWLGPDEVDEPVWTHFLVVTAPERISSDIGFLTIAGGRRGSDMPDAAPATDVKRALESGTVVSTLYGVPNQPLVFAGDNDSRRVEDAIIAWTWDRHLRSGDDKWPLRLPMTKAAVRAMDTITALMASEQGASVERFVVAGGSKRGWTAWTTGIVDGRVVAIVPVVIDLLNVGESFKHHFAVYGSYSPAVVDYVANRVVNWIGTPEWDRLMDLVEPYEYRERLNLRKFLVNSTGDEFFLPDSSRFYWDDLPGEKHLRYVPNSNHSMEGTDFMDSIDAWYHGVVHNVKMPRYSWRLAEDGTISVFTLDQPRQVLLWQAHNPERRNFTQAVLGRAYSSSPLAETEPGVYRVKLEAPERGYTAYFVELHFPSGIEVPFKFSTAVRIVPDLTEHRWEMLPDSAREPRRGTTQ